MSIFKRSRPRYDADPVIDELSVAVDSLEAEVDQLEKTRQEQFTAADQATLTNLMARGRQFAQAQPFVDAGTGGLHDPELLELHRVLARQCDLEHAEHRSAISDLLRRAPGFMASARELHAAIHDRSAEDHLIFSDALENLTGHRSRQHPPVDACSCATSHLAASGDPWADVDALSDHGDEEVGS